MPSVNIQGLNDGDIIYSAPLNSNFTNLQLGVAQSVAKTGDTMTGTLTISSGGVNVTGNSTITGTLNVSGTITGNVTGNLTGTANKANNIVGGAVGSILYQTSLDTTSTLSIGSNGYVLTSSGTLPQWTESIAIANGGTGATTAAAARTNLGVAASGVNSDITSLTGLTTAITVAQGGTGSTTGSITGTGALTFTSGGSNTNITLAPNGTGVVDISNKNLHNIKNIKYNSFAAYAVGTTTIDYNNGNYQSIRITPTSGPSTTNLTINNLPLDKSIDFNVIFNNGGTVDTTLTISFTGTVRATKYGNSNTASSISIPPGKQYILKILVFKLDSSQADPDVWVNALISI